MSYTLLSFDIGIKNLAYCLLDVSTAPLCRNSVECNRAQHLGCTKTPKVECGHQYNILDWRVLDLLQVPQDQDASVDAPRCTCTLAPKKRGDAVRVCGKLAKYAAPVESDPPHYVCETHAKSNKDYLMPKKAYERPALNRLKKDELVAFSQKFPGGGGVCAQEPKKAGVDALCAYFARTCWVPALSAGTTQCTTQCTLRAKDADLITLGRNLKTILDGIPLLDRATHVIMENQISTIASRMKTLQGELTMYFIMKDAERHIEYISSANKLKDFVGTTPAPAATATTSVNAKYRQHKHDAILYTHQLLESTPHLRSWIPTLSGKKKDDLADCFLQGVWYIKKQRNQMVPL